MSGPWRFFFCGSLVAHPLGAGLFAILFAAVEVCLPRAHGELITFQFSGTVSKVVGYGWPFYPEDIEFPQVGDLVTGFYTFDSNAPDGADSQTSGSFSTVLPQTALSVSIGATQLEGRAVRIDAYRNIFAPPRNYYGAGDGIPALELTSDPVLAQVFDRNHFSLSIAGENLFSDPNVLPLTPPSLDGTTHGMTISLDSRYNVVSEPLVLAWASLDALTAVPEPSDAMLLVTLLVFQMRIATRRHNDSNKGLSDETTKASGARMWTKAPL